MKYKFIQLNEEQEKNAAIAREIIYAEVAKHLPKSCSCGREYKTEIEYTNRTKRAHNALYEEGTLVFTRNCPCNSTLCISLIMDDLPEGKKQVDDYFKALGNAAKQDFLANSLEGLAGKYILSTEKLCLHSIEHLQTHGGDMTKVIPAIEELGIADYFWKNVGINIFRDVHNDFIREKEQDLMPKHRVLIINPRKDEFKDFYLPNTKISYRQTLSTGKRALNDNPEGTSAIILDLEDRTEQFNFLDWLRRHDSTNTEITKSELILRYKTGKTLPVFSFGDQKPFDEHHFILQKPCYELARIVQESFKKHH